MGVVAIRSVLLPLQVEASHPIARLSRQRLHAAHRMEGGYLFDVLAEDREQRIRKDYVRRSPSLSCPSMLPVPTTRTSPNSLDSYNAVRL